MKKIIKRFIKQDSSGRITFEATEESNMGESGDIVATKTQTMFQCPRCGNMVEQFNVRLNCPICVVCCDWCHEQIVKVENTYFERIVLLERERLRWLESKILDELPGVTTIRRLAGISGIKRLERLRKRLRIK